MHSQGNFSRHQFTERLPRLGTRKPLITYKSILLASV
jgi:hypothetical protein